MKNTETHHLIRFEKDASQAYEQELIGEEPLSIRIEGKPYSVVMRTPGEEISHVAGFCLSEGLVDQPEDFSTIGYCEEMNTNIATVILRPDRRKKVSALLKRRGFISQTSCGICGKELIEDLCQAVKPVRDDTKIKISQAIQNAEKLIQHQDLYKKTRSSHAVMILDSRLNVLAVAEDVGRHNALDKAIGKIFMEGALAHARIATLSSRISYELVQKAARAQLPILISISRPTSLAVELGKKLNLTIVSVDNGSDLLAFCGIDRLIK